ncbi:MAG: IS110 family transposase [Actinomycetota bacterium]|nr:IS110 family transposase [Actinomycetota bacterium]
MPNHTVTVGIDVGDRYSYLCRLDTGTGEVIEESRITTSPTAFERCFSGGEPMRVAIEAGTHSPWMSGVLEACGHEVLVANARKLKLIYGEGRKNDRLDAENLARIARLDPRLLSPLRHRGEASRAHLALIRSRDVLVEARTKLVNHVRGAVKPFGVRMPKCSVEAFPAKARERVPEALAPALDPILETEASLTTRIRQYDRDLEALSRELYPETLFLRQVQGVGLLTALAFVLVLEDPARFETSRAVGAYAGLTPGQDQSGERDPQQRISGRGDEMLRKLLVQSAHYVLGPFAQDSDLRRHGEKIAGRGGKNAKKRAVVAVARKLSVLLHRLWMSGEVYEPLYNARRAEAAPT